MQGIKTPRNLCHRSPQRVALVFPHRRIRAYIIKTFTGPSCLALGRALILTEICTCAKQDCIPGMKLEQAAPQSVMAPAARFGSKRAIVRAELEKNTFSF
eukprot:1772128-Rhodomonas_salina.2